MKSVKLPPATKPVITNTKFGTVSIKPEIASTTANENKILNTLEQAIRQNVFEDADTTSPTNP